MSDSTSTEVPPIKKELTPKEKAAARQAKLLANSSSRLAKITSGAEGRVISDAAVGIQSRPPTAPTVPSLPPPPSNLALNDDEDPEEIDLSLSSPPPQLNPFDFSSMFGGPPGSGIPGADGAGGDPFAQLLARFGAPGGGPGAGSNPFGGVGPGGLPTAPLSPIPPTPKTLLDKLFPWLHLFAMVGLAVYAVGWVEPKSRGGVWDSVVGTGGRVNWGGWSALGESKKIVSGLGLEGGTVAQVPLLWMFVTVELLLQTTRIFLLRNRPTPPSLLNSILPIVSTFSPQLATVISTGQKYLQLFTILLNDFAVLVFCIGAIVIFSRWKVGARGHGFHGILEKVVEGEIGGAGWNAARNEL